MPKRPRITLQAYNNDCNDCLAKHSTVYCTQAVAGSLKSDTAGVERRLSAKWGGNARSMPAEKSGEENENPLHWRRKNRPSFLTFANGAIIFFAISFTFNMILALVFLPVMLGILTVGMPVALFLLAVATTIRYAFSVAYDDCSLSWKLLTGTEDPGDPVTVLFSSSRIAATESSSTSLRALSPPPGLETIPEEEHGRTTFAPVAVASSSAAKRRRSRTRAAAVRGNSKLEVEIGCGLVPRRGVVRNVS